MVIIELWSTNVSEHLTEIRKFSVKDEFENNVCKMATILFRSICIYVTFVTIGLENGLMRVRHHAIACTNNTHGALKNHS